MNDFEHILNGNTYKFLPDMTIKPKIHPSAAIRNALVIGNITIEENVHLVNCILRADEGTPFYISKGSNIQDFVIIHAYTTQEEGQKISKNLVYVKNYGEFAVFIGENTSLSHGVLIHGPSYIGNNTFIGFKSTIDNADVGSNAEIGAHCYIKNVIIPDNTAILPGSIITKPYDIEKYQTTPTQINDRIVTINREMAKYYCHHNSFLE